MALIITDATKPMRFKELLRCVGWWGIEQRFVAFAITFWAAGWFFAAHPAVAASQTESVSESRQSPGIRAGDFQLVKTRYEQWLLDDDATDYSNPFVLKQYEGVIHRARRAREMVDAMPFAAAPLYDTRRSGADRRELYRLVTEILPDLSTAYHLRGPATSENPFFHDDDTLAVVLRVFDRLHERGFRADMQMPWKARDGRETSPPTAIVVDFHLRTSGFAVATFLMRDELQAAGRLQRTLDTCRAICRQGDKTGDLGKLKLNADGVRIAANFILPYALAAGDADRVMKLKRQIDRSMAIESDASDTIKPDGLGFHHLGVYMAGYAPYAVSQSAQMAWLFRDTQYRLDPQTIDNLRRSLFVLRIVSQKYDMHKALAGRLRSIAVIPDVLLGYAYLADLEERDEHSMSRALVRLCDQRFLGSDQAHRPFSGHRDEATPGPKMVDFFFQSLKSAGRWGAEPEPEGNWALNYGPMSVHRRDDWMVSVKGFSKYLWAFERSLTDALDEERRQNVLGFHDSSCTIRIHCQGKPIGAEASGYGTDGWDWCHRPGATVRLIDAERLLQMDRLGRRFNRPFARSPFAGGVSLGGRHGLFAMDYSEVSCDERDPPLQANKSIFFFDDQIVCLTSDIRHGDGVFPVVTTLYQSSLGDVDAATWEQGRRNTSVPYEKRYSGGKSLTLIDPAGNGYFIPRADNLMVRRSVQQSLDYTATRETAGRFATAWFDHGLNPDRANCEYVILVRTDPDALARFASRADDVYQVLQQDRNAHIVRHRPLGLTGYAVFRGGAPLADELITESDVPCLVMTSRQTDSSLKFSVCNPDLGWEPGKQYLFRPKERPNTNRLAQPPPMPVTLTLRGDWQLVAPHQEVEIHSASGATRVHVRCSDGRSVAFQVRPAR